MTSGRRNVKFDYTKFADFFGNDRQTFDQLSVNFRQFKNWPNWIVSTSVKYQARFRLPDIAINSLIKFFQIVLSDADNKRFKNFPTSSYMIR